MTQECSEIRRHVGPTESVSYAVINAIAALKNVGPMDVPPLHEAVDADALDRLFASRTNGLPRTGGCLSFSLANCEIVVQSNGTISVTEAEDSTPTMPTAVAPSEATDAASQGAGRSD